MHLPRPARPSRRAGAFTLVEFLVALAVVAVLAVLLMGAVSRVAEAGRRVRCIHNLSTLGKGFQSYMNENQLTLPSPNETSEIQPGATAPADWMFAVQRYVPYSPEVYLCDSNPVKFKSDRVPSTLETNYAINYWMREGMQRFPLFLPRISPLAVPAPSRVGLLLDGTAAWIKKEQPARVAWCHGGAVNVLFLDGHVETRTRSGLLDAAGEVACLDQPDRIR
jgi:prepilin-type processing-associated H-X9-DG protein/prepilin-type N-terminal cleavage/methylation domain-containing protein